MKKMNWRMVLLCLTLTVFALSFVACDSGSDDENTDGDQEFENNIPADGDEAKADGDKSENSDNAVADGDDSEAADGTDNEVSDTEVTETTEATETDGETQPVKGSISGNVITSNDFAQWDKIIKLFNNNPFAKAGLQEIAKTAIAGGTETSNPYSFKDLANDEYYIVLYIDVNDNNDAKDGFKDDLFYVYNSKLQVVAVDDKMRDYTGIDLYAGGEKDDTLGSISGKLHLSPAYQDYDIAIIASDASSSAPTEVFLRSTAFTFKDSGTAERSFMLGNLPSGTYNIYAWVTIKPEDPILGYTNLRELEIDTTARAAKDLTDVPFYVGLKDPDFGSITGTINLARPQTGGDLGIYLVNAKVVDERAEEPEFEFFPETTIAVKKDDSGKSFSYELGNLRDGQTYLVAAYLNMPESAFAELKIAASFYDKFWQGKPLEMSYDAQTAEKKKHWSNINIELPLAELKGKLTINHADYPDPRWAKIYLLDADVAIGTGIITKVNDYGGFTQVNYKTDTPETRASSGDYSIFPIKSGTWYKVVVISKSDTDATLSDWCLMRNLGGITDAEVTISDSDTVKTKDITVTKDLSWVCQPAPAR